MPVEITHYPVIGELHEVQTRTQSIIDKIEGDIEPSIHQQNTDIHDLTTAVGELEERLYEELAFINYEQFLNYKRQKRFFIASLIYALLSIGAIVYLFLR